MKNFKASENATRKSVFAYIRKNPYLTQTDFKKEFGSSKVVKAAIAEAQDRISRNAPVQSIREQFIAKLRKNADALSGCLPSSGYSMGEYKHVTNKQFNIRGSWNSTQEYARSCTWRVKHGTVDLELPIALIGKLEAMEGVMTLRGKQIQQGIWKCEWLVLDYTRDGRGFINSEITYYMEKGYVVRREQYDWYNKGGWFHTTNLADARKHLKKFNEERKAYLKKKARAAKFEAEREAAREKELKRRERQQAKEKKELLKSVKHVEKSAEMKDTLQHMYVYQDSIKAGNCVPGTNGFLKAHNLQKTDTRSGEFLLRISRNSWQHNNVIRILINYVQNTYPEFYAQNVEAIRIILKNK